MKKILKERFAFTVFGFISSPCKSHIYFRKNLGRARLLSEIVQDSENELKKKNAKHAKFCSNNFREGIKTKSHLLKERCAAGNFLNNVSFEIFG